ncbi:MAG: hypothetical protein KKA79_06045 [Nanoarchaeota archaeon]|nr:hypothetical protein [Nanoarchaeota archaeon]
MELYVGDSVSIILAVVGILSIIISLIISDRSLKKADDLNDKILKQTEENLLTQLQYADSKKALFTLHKVLKESKTYADLKVNFSNFLNSLDGQFTPIETKRGIYEKFNAMDEYINKNDPAKQAEEEYFTHMEEHHEAEYGEYLRLRDEERSRWSQVEHFEYDFSEKMDSLRADIDKEIKKHLSKPTKRN